MTTTTMKTNDEYSHSLIIKLVNFNLSKSLFWCRLMMKCDVLLTAILWWRWSRLPLFCGRIKYLQIISLRLNSFESFIILLFVVLFSCYSTDKEERKDRSIIFFSLLCYVSKHLFNSSKHLPIFIVQQ
jgi:hypothetical protein